MAKPKTSTAAPIKADDYYRRALTLDDGEKKRIADDAVKMGRSMNAADPVLKRADEIAIAEDYLLQQGQTPSSYKSMGEWNKAVADVSGEAAKKFLYPLTDTGKSEARANAMATGLGAVESAKQMANASLPENVAKAGNWNERGIDTDIETGKVTGKATRTAPTVEGGEVFQVAGTGGYGSTTRSPEQAAAIAQQQADSQKRAAQFQQGLAARRKDAVTDAEKIEPGSSILARWENERKLEEEGKDIQRSNRKQLAAMESAEKPRAVRGQGRVYPLSTLSAEDFQKWQDDKKSLKESLSARQGLNKSEVSEVAQTARERRKKQLQEEELLNAQNEEAKRAAATKAKSAQSSRSGVADIMKRFQEEFRL